MPKPRAEYIGDPGGRGFKFPFKPSLPGKGRMAATLALLVFIILSGLYFTFLEYVRPYEYGIKEVQIALRGGSKGIQEKVKAALTTRGVSTCPHGSSGKRTLWGSASGS